MIKLLQINSVVNIGSTGRIAEDIGKLAIENGWKSYIAYGRNAKSSESQLLKIGDNFDFKIHALDTRLFDRHGMASKNATKEFFEKLKIVSPDIIHLHNIHGYYVNIELLFAYLEIVQKPVVWTFHDCWPITGHCSHFSYVGCEKWETECYKCPQKKDYPASWLIDRSKKNFKLKKKLFTSLQNLTIVSVSKWLSGIINNSYLGYYPTKIIYNGINTQVFKPYIDSDFRIKHHIENKFILLGVASVWNQRKGLNDFLKLSKVLNNEYKIILVGLTTKQIEHLPEGILGFTRTESADELALMYSAADIVLNLSYEETFGLTTVEGLACGTPGIVYNSTASPELIDESTGLVIEPGDINELVEAVEKIKKKGKQSYSNACVKRAYLLYRKEDCYKNYIELYESLL